MSTPSPTFGDNVRVRATPETEEAGLAGLAGEVHGETRPSSSGVTDVIGGAADDYALNVWIEERGEGFWLAPHLVELVDHAPGTEIRLKGVPARWVRQPSGEWLQLPGEPGPSSDEG